MVYLQGADFSEVRRASGWRLAAGAVLMVVEDVLWALEGARAAAREAAASAPKGPADSNAKDRARVSGRPVQRCYASEQTPRAAGEAQVTRGREPMEFRRDCFPRPLRVRLLMNTPGPAKVLLDGKIQDPPKDFLGPPPQRRPPPPPRGSSESSCTLSPTSQSLFEDIAHRTASLMVLGRRSSGGPELHADNRISDRPAHPPNDARAEGGAPQGRAEAPGLLRAAQAAVRGLWGGRGVADAFERPRSRSSDSSPVDRKLDFLTTVKNSLRDAHFSKKDALPGIRLNDADLKSASQKGGSASLRSRRAAAATAAAAAVAAGGGEPPSSLAPGDSPPLAGRPISRRSRSEPQRN